jgi:hypothetical protein
MSSSLPFYLCAMALYWAAVLWVANRPGTPAGPRTRLMVVAALLWTTLLLTACGGGDPEPEPDVETPRVNCAQNPEACK